MCHLKNNALCPALQHDVVILRMSTSWTGPVMLCQHKDVVSILRDAAASAWVQQWSIPYEPS
jgi:hypothetical protein